MHFQVIEDDFFKNLHAFLKESVPEFISIFDRSDEIYLVLGEFGRFVIENISNESIAQKCFNFINASIERGGYKTEDAIVLQIFEQLYDDKRVAIEVRKYLSGKALAFFEKFYPKP